MFIVDYRCYQSFISLKWLCHILTPEYFHHLGVRYTQRYSQNIHNYYNEKIFLEYFEIIFEIF